MNKVTIFFRVHEVIISVNKTYREIRTIVLVKFANHTRCSHEHIVTLPLTHILRREAELYNQFIAGKINPWMSQSRNMIHYI